MRAIVRHEPAYPVLVVDLEPNEVVLAEAGSMVARHAGVSIALALDAGGDTGFVARARALVVAVIRKWVSGAHFHANRFVAPAEGGWVWIAPPLAGEVREVSIGPGATWTLSPGAYVASDPRVKLRPRFAGLAALLSREASFWLDATGEGTTWITGHGAIETIEVDGSHVIAADHLVAFTSSLTPRFSAWKRRAFLRHDDARDVELVGRGRALVQSRGVRALAAWLSPRLPE